MSLAAAPAIHQPVPRLAEPFEPAPGDATGPIAASPPSSQEPRTNSADVADTIAAGEKKQPKKRSLFGFAKHKKPDNQPTTNKATPTSPAPSDPTSPQRLVEPTQPINFPAVGSGARQQQHTAAAMPPAPTSHPTTIMGSPALSPPMPAAATPSSPRLSSPAGSQIFERDVQESASVLSPSSPAIPSHIQTENYIPPVLDASSEAITDDHLDPDTVEIITASVHQPAGLAVGAAGSGSPPIESLGPSWTDELAAFAAAKERASNRDLHSETSGPHSNNNASGIGSLANNYGSLDSTDVRRLSFISFADVVQAEQQHHQAAGAMGASGTLVLPGSRESMASTSQQTQTIIQQTFGQPRSQSSSPGGQPPAWQANSPQLPQHLSGHLVSLAAVRNRSPSPFRSPPAAGGVGGVGVIAGSPPTSKSGSIHGLDMSPGRRTMGSPTLTAAGLSISGASVSSGSAAELTIETMSQALRKTGSGDLGSGTLRSHPTSPI